MHMFFLKRGLAVLALIFAQIYHILCDEHTFLLDNENNQFLKDGEPYRYISASMHYFRVPSAYWEDRLLKFKYLGLDAIQTYVAWNFHETYEKQYNFVGDKDIFKFLSLAKKVGLDVILRPGPYIDAEWDMGGLPYWLLKNKTLVSENTLRTLDEGYFKHVERWYDVLLPRLLPYLYKNGGPIISVQVENEYGSYFACDQAYLLALSDLIRKHLGSDIFLFTTDGNDMGYMKCGKIPGVYATVDFGTGSDVVKSFDVQRQVNLRGGPFVNSEFYVGWIDHWGYPHSHISADRVTKTLTEILDTSNTTCVNLYMGHGGTSFGFWNGAETSYVGTADFTIGKPNSYEFIRKMDLSGKIARQIAYSYNLSTDPSKIHYFPNPTSYDFDAPISEGGDLTPKYFEIRKTLANYKDLPGGDPPKTHPKVAYGSMTLYRVEEDIFELIETTLSHRVFSYRKPPTFEELDHPYGYVVYTHYWTDADNAKFNITKLSSEYHTVVIEAKGIRDRAYMYLNKDFIGLADRMTEVNKFEFIVPYWPFPAGVSIRFIVENQGRICYGNQINDTKGILDGIYLNGTYINDWDVYPLNSTEINEIIMKRTEEEVKDPQAFKLKYSRKQNIENTRTNRSRKIWFDQKRITSPKDSVKELTLTSISAGPKFCTPSFFAGHFALPVEEFGIYPNDTYLDLNGWFKGAVFVNGHNLGRYWTTMGPQKTLYLPGVYLRTNGNINTLSLFEIESRPPCNFPAESINFVDKPVIIKSTESFFTPPTTKVRIPLLKPSNQQGLQLVLNDMVIKMANENPSCPINKLKTIFVTLKRSKNYVIWSNFVKIFYPYIFYLF